MVKPKPYYLLKLFIDSTDEELRNLYKAAALKHNAVVETYFQHAAHVCTSAQHVGTSAQHVGTVHVDAGFDLFAPDKVIMAGRQTWKVDHLVKTSMEFMSSESTTHESTTQESLPVGYYLYPRSSTGTKTPLRLANSVGIIDSGYRGHIIAVFDNWTEMNYTIEPYQRLAQICPPNLTYPIYVQLVDSVDGLGLTKRGEEGFGSTGK